MVPACPLDAPSLEAQIARVRSAFAARFGRLPSWIAAAPGRVNLIGEHTDYNGGFVLPLAIERCTLAAGGRPVAAADARVRLRSTALDADGEFLAADLQPERRDWTSYVRGVYAGFLQRDASPGALDLVIDSEVPVGSGLSSSAALEMAAATLFEAASGVTLPPVEKARLCQQAEHQFAGMPCGIMDQFSSALGAPGRLLLIDCRRETAEPVPLDDPAIALLVVDSRVKHELSGGAYAARRRECEEAAGRLGAARLCDLSSAVVGAAADQLGPVLLRRALHVAAENERTLAAAAALRRRAWKEVGGLMDASHRSLRDGFEVSCPELDALADLAAEIGPAGGVYGARMTGGGFGGCLVALIDAPRRQAIAERLLAGYRRLTGRAATAFVTQPAAGARLLPADGPLAAAACRGATQHGA